jgi:hypothetical protein
MRRILVALALSLAGACSAPTVAAPQGEPASGRAAITAACGGGVTGGSEGITITPDDHVISWEQASADAHRQETDLGADPVFAADVRRQLEAIRFADIRYSETGNMTCSLSAGGHEVSWRQGDPAAPSGALDVHELVFTADGRE